MTEAIWTLDELTERVGAALSVGYDGQPSGRVRDLPDQRAIRWYTTIGLVDRPAATRGRTAMYGPRHLVQRGDGGGRRRDPAGGAPGGADDPAARPGKAARRRRPPRHPRRRPPAARGAPRPRARPPRQGAPMTTSLPLLTDEEV